jgi:HTH-type transcriptional regulator, sugar sensing transcriptional regulator
MYYSSMKSHHVALEAFGLSEKEAAVYAAALELGPATADQLSKQANIKRSTTYVQIESLQKVGLMSSYEEGKKTFFAPESPQNLERLLERQQKELELKQSDLKKYLPDLTHLFEGAGERPVVRFYQGKEGIMTMREEMLDSVSKEFLTLYNHDRLNSIFTDTEREVYSRRREAIGIKSRLIYSRQEGPFETERFNLTERRHLDDKDFLIEADIVIFDRDKVSFSNLQGHIFGVIVQSYELAASLQSLFNFLWIGLKK